MFAIHLKRECVGDGSVKKQDHKLFKTTPTKNFQFYAIQRTFFHKPSRDLIYNFLVFMSLHPSCIERKREETKDTPVCYCSFTTCEGSTDKMRRRTCSIRQLIGNPRQRSRTLIYQLHYPFNNDTARGREAG